MPDKRSIHQRQSIRLKEYDYTAAGAYFVTIATWQKEPLLGEVENGVVRLSPLGQCAADSLQGLTAHFPLQVDEWVVMPDHLHAILVINANATCGEVGKTSLRPCGVPAGTIPGSLGAIVQNFKSLAARRISALRRTPGARVWQRNYYEHIIRDWDDMERIRLYIRNNPLRWGM